MAGHAMKPSRFTEEQIAFALKQWELGTPVAEVCRKMGVSDATLYNWRKSTVGWVPRSSSACASLRRRTASSSSWWRI